MAEARMKPHTSRKPPSLKRRVALLSKWGMSKTEIARAEKIDRETVTRILDDPRTPWLATESIEVPRVPVPAPERAIVQRDPHDAPTMAAEHTSEQADGVLRAAREERWGDGRLRTWEEWQAIGRRGGRRVVSSVRAEPLAGGGIW